MPSAGDGNSVASNAYSEGGNLFALGLIHANHHDDGIINHLLGELQRATVDGVQVGENSLFALRTTFRSQYMETARNEIN